MTSDNDLLARLNALKRSHIDLDDKQQYFPVVPEVRPSADPSAVNDLQADLLSRFKSLKGTPQPVMQSAHRKSDSATESKKSVQNSSDDGKTFEELVAELGPEDSWDVDRDEQTQINDLLESAQDALRHDKCANPLAASRNETEPHRSQVVPVGGLPDLDVEFQIPQDDDYSDEEMPRKTKADLRADIDRQADDIVSRIKAEVESEQLRSESIEPDDREAATDRPGPSLPSAPSFDLPITPTEDPVTETSPQARLDDDSLSSRFALLSFPTAPSTLAKRGFARDKQSNLFGNDDDDKDAESWCIICDQDATLCCLGCDDDLYCTKCWLQGHRGDDAGLDERTHKAMQYNGGGGLKKERARKRKVAVGSA